MVTGSQRAFKLNRVAEIFGNRKVLELSKRLMTSRKSGVALFPICNVTPIKLCGIVQVAAAERSSMAMSVVDLERDGSAGFSDLYVHLLKTALDEMHPSLSPEMRERNLAAHIACGISMSGVWFVRLRCAIEKQQRARRLRAARP
jgi:hypothetical protein